MLCRDLSYWGFEQLAHPLNGIMMTEFRPVSCDTHQPLQFNPGFINSTIYGDKVETGWAWFPYKQNTDNFWLPVNALSVHLPPNVSLPECIQRGVFLDLRIISS